MSLDSDIQSIVAARRRLPGLPGELVRLLEALAAYHDSVEKLVGNLGRRREDAGKLLDALQDVLPALEHSADGHRVQLTQAAAALVDELDGLLETLDRAEDAVRDEAATTVQELGSLSSGLQVLAGDMDARRDRGRAAIVKTNLSLIESSQRLEEAISVAGASGLTLVPLVTAAGEQANTALGQLRDQVETLRTAATAHLEDAAKGRLALRFPAHQQEIEAAIGALEQCTLAVVQRLDAGVMKEESALEQAITTFLGAVASVQRVLQEADRKLAGERAPLDQAHTALQGAFAPMPGMVMEGLRAAEEMGEQW